MRSLELRVAGVPVRVDPLFLLAMGLLGWAMGRQGLFLLAWMVVACTAVLVHELGHALAFRRFGAQPEVVLWGLGGYTTGDAQPPWRSVVVSMAGPAVGLAAGGAVLVGSRVTGPLPPLAETALADLVFVNLGWGLFNLLPILPLDGGNVVSAGLDGLTGGRGEKPARIVSVLTAVTIGLLALWADQRFVVLLVAWFGIDNVQALLARRDRPGRTELERARSMVLVGDTAGAAGTAREVLASSPSARLAAEAVEVLAWAELAAGRPEKADAALAGSRGVGTSPLVRTTVALACGRPSPPLAPAFAACPGLVAARVAAGAVADRGLLDRLVEDLRSLPADQAAQGLRCLQQGLESAGRIEEATRVAGVLAGSVPAEGEGGHQRGHESPGGEHDPRLDGGSAGGEGGV